MEAVSTLAVGSPKEVSLVVLKESRSPEAPPLGHPVEVAVRHGEEELNWGILQNEGNCLDKKHLILPRQWKSNFFTILESLRK